MCADTGLEDNEGAVKTLKVFEIDMHVSCLPDDKMVIKWPPLT